MLSNMSEIFQFFAVIDLQLRRWLHAARPTSGRHVPGGSEYG